jgi:hypothetical protein
MQLMPGKTLLKRPTQHPFAACYKNLHFSFSL